MSSPSNRQLAKLVPSMIVERQRLLSIQQSLEVLALEILHGQEEVLVDRVDLVDGDDILVRELGEGLGFAQQPRAPRPMAVAFAQDLDGDLAVHRELHRPVHRKHRAGHSCSQTDQGSQHNDIGTQYRSAIFPLDDEQRAEAEAAIQRWNDDHAGQNAVTTIETGEWYPAEDYHQEYWDGEGQRNPYCLAVIPPKLMKLRKSFADKVKG